MLGALFTFLGFAAPVSASTAVFREAKEYLPEVLGMAAKAVSNHPYAALGITAGTSLLCYFAQRGFERDAAYAHTSGYRNNCGLHSIIHNLFRLTPGKISELANTYPIFNEIAQAFYDYYELPGDPSWYGFVEICKQFDHPYDREILLGQVLRQVLRNKLLNNSPDYIEQDEIMTVLDDEMLNNNLLSIITKEMGAKLKVYNTTSKNAYDRIQIFSPDYERASWNIEIFHLGDHYETKYATSEENEKHNRLWKDISKSKLAKLVQDDVQDKELIKGVVHSLLPNAYEAYSHLRQGR